MCAVRNVASINARDTEDRYATHPADVSISVQNRYDATVGHRDEASLNRSVDLQSHQLI
jgi:hypothetical protein